MHFATLLVLLLVTAPARPADAPGIVLPLHSRTPEDLAALRDRIVPSAEESVWRSIPWRTNLQDGIADAHASVRPILLWLMNGHPMGCT